MANWEQYKSKLSKKDTMLFEERQKLNRKRDALDKKEKKLEKQKNLAEEIRKNCLRTNCYENWELPIININQHDPFCLDSFYFNERFIELSPNECLEIDAINQDPVFQKLFGACKRIEDVIRGKHPKLTHDLKFLLDPNADLSLERYSCLSDIIYSAHIDEAQSFHYIVREISKIFGDILRRKMDEKKYNSLLNGEDEIYSKLNSLEEKFSKPIKSDYYQCIF